jgi:hypothetical protein
VARDTTAEWGTTGAAPPIVPEDISTRIEAEDVIRSGDIHVHGVQSLCVGESQ